ncbi:MAG: LOG family protein [Candidatus Binataceae bacterium]|nr:LOG family protein [Candidatus Binataceae bacterium]
MTGESGSPGDEIREGGVNASGVRGFPADKPIVVVFGSSVAKPGDGLYEQGRRMGELIGRAGFNMMTGGYTGLMEAASHGAHEAGARVIGITLKKFAEKPNPFVRDEISTATFSKRFKWLIGRADAYVAMRGGMGTLAEVSFAWQELAVEMIAPRPLILVGAAWRAIVECWTENLLTGADEYRLITLVETPEEASAKLSEFFAVHPISRRARRAAS